MDIPKAEELRSIIAHQLPVIPTMDVVVFPSMIVPLLVLDERIIKGINRALDSDKAVFLLASQKQVSDQNSSIETKDLYNIGTIASIIRMINLPEGGVKILVQGVAKATTQQLEASPNALEAMVQLVVQEKSSSEREITCITQQIREMAQAMASAGKIFSPDFHLVISKMTSSNSMTDYILSHLELNVEEAQQLLETNDELAFLYKVLDLLKKESDIVEINERIKNHARESMNQSQREFYLREQLKAIKKELGEDDSDDIESLRTKAAEVDLSPEARTEVNRQLNRLDKMSPDSMESAVTRNYLDWVTALPWNKNTADNLDIIHAKKILDENHYGLKAIKERILDFISIKQLKSDGYAPILCFVGPPGTGKTSLGKSIADALGRNYVRIALGGVRDEAEIRGHRRTYVGAMPGRFVQGIRKAGSTNPVIIIDEIDKIGQDFRGDPSAAMLEILDPAQNKTFFDNYLGVPFDLSKAMFIATANQLDTITGPLRDRMEIIELSGYTIHEKIHIARNHLMQRAIGDTGLEINDMKLSDSLLETIIGNYTREAGVRELDRVLHKLCAKAARVKVEEKKSISFNAKNLEKHLGNARFVFDESNKENAVGITNGLAWTSAGGEMIKIEAVIMPGTGKLILTGYLGDVMKESAQAALSYARSHADKFDIAPEMFSKYDLHIHAPAGGVPKDGPSAGITMLSSILSCLTNRPIDSTYAMTGEINLQGHVMPIGGIREKILAAKRNHIPHVLLPEKNKSDVKELDDILDGIKIIWCKHADDVLHRVLMGQIKQH
ncbi:endopeptidase La [bacterium]|nr:endopeptidase La [bacterium]MBT3903315.1 endopeptidase La [bacterium]MBT5345723.1 endopeptidase La [bacterium]